MFAQIKDRVRKTQMEPVTEERHRAGRGPDRQDERTVTHVFI